MNLLIKGDNLAAMRWLASGRGLAGKVDLIYTDPPFATNSDFIKKTIIRGSVEKNAPA